MLIHVHRIRAFEVGGICTRCQATGHLFIDASARTRARPNLMACDVELANRGHGARCYVVKHNLGPSYTVGLSDCISGDLWTGGANGQHTMTVHSSLTGRPQLTVARS